MDAYGQEQDGDDAEAEDPYYNEYDVDAMRNGQYR